MTKTQQEWVDEGQQAYKCALQFIQDAGYEDCHVAQGRHEWGELIYEFRIEARRGPHATRKTPVEHLVVRVRVTGPDHKTLRPSFVTPPPDGAA